MSMPDYSIADIAAVAGKGNGGEGFGNGDGAWWLLILFALLGGFNRGGYGQQGGGAGSVGGNEIYPWLNQSEVVSNGFQNLYAQLCNCCNDMQMQLASGFAGVNTNLCNGLAGVNLGISNGFNQAEIAANERQMASMQQAFGTQTAITQGITGLSQQLADCCCENRLATANQTATILAENCADRAALSDGVRDIITSQTANTQRILDKLCDQELFAERRENDRLRQEASFANLAASQTAQTAQILAAQNSAMDSFYNRLSSCPVPSMPVYGMQPIFTCNNGGNGGCGCGGYAYAA